MNGASMKFIELNRWPIEKQLELERDLLRNDAGSYCIVNEGTHRAIVMGISGKEEELLDVKRVEEDEIPVLRRFSGGGTVIVDEETFFVTFIVSKEHFEGPLFPEPILRWAGDHFEKSWKIPHFHTQENDYVIGDLKCGGNAQYIQKDRWLQHTSFLWDYKPENMAYLLMPEKRPAYRKNRLHGEFLCKLKDYVPSRRFLIDALKAKVSSLA